jgi:hypothetical protein
MVKGLYIQNVCVCVCVCDAICLFGFLDPFVHSPYFSNRMLYLTFVANVLHC